MTTTRDPIWSEDKGLIGDAIQSIEGSQRIQQDDSDEIKETIVKAGVVLVQNCLYCGKQVKLIVPWADVANLHLQREHPSYRREKRGYTSSVPCRSCNRPTRMSFDQISDLRRWVDHGVAMGSLKASIYQASLVSG